MRNVCGGALIDGCVGEVLFQSGSLALRRDLVQMSEARAIQEAHRPGNESGRVATGPVTTLER